MNSRLISWCLVATGFFAALTVLSWQRKLAAPDQRVQSQASVAQRLPQPTGEHLESWMAQTPAASEAPENGPTTLILPLPPATEPEPVPDVQPLPDDAPTVEDLPAPRNPPESPEGQ
jgi:hypothetical protein